MDEEPTFGERFSGFIRDHRGGFIALICTVALILILAIAGIVILTLSGSAPGKAGKVLNNVTISGINIGGMSREEAISAVRNKVGNVYETTDMVVRIDDAVVVLSPSGTGARLDCEAAVDEALRYGHEGSTADQAQAYAASLTSNHAVELVPHLSLNEAYIRSELFKQTQQLSSQFQQSAYALEGTQPSLAIDQFDPEAPCQTLVVNVGSSGVGVDANALMEQILEAYEQGRFQLEAKAALTEQPPLPIDLDAIYQAVYIAPVEATANSAGSYGYDFDLNEAKTQLRFAQENEIIRIPLRIVQPAASAQAPVSTSDFPDVLGSCQTPHNNNENRNTNLRLLCQALNGIVLQPGDTLSYNETLGERTAAKGYKPAPAYSGFNTVDTIGGGVCQGSSTLYYCALLADLEIVDRINHGFLSSYIDPGMDATVSWPGPDLKIRNDTGYPIKILAEYDDSFVKMQILGTDTKDYYVKMEYQMSYIAAEVEYRDEEPGGIHADGDVLEEGHDGAFVNTYRCKYDKKTNALISRTLEARSSYPMLKRIIVRIPSAETEPEETEPTVTEPDVSTPTEPVETEPGENEPDTPPAPSTEAPTEPPTVPEPAPEETYPDPEPIPLPEPEPIPEPVIPDI